MVAVVSSASAVLGASGSPVSEVANRLAIAVAGSHGRRLAGAPPRPLGPRDFTELIRVAERHRLLGALAEVVEAELLPVDDVQRRELTERHTSWLIHALRVERLLNRTATCAAAAGIDMRVLKGVALARLAYSDPAWRVFSDLDVLVPSERLDDMVRIIGRELGGVPAAAELRPGFNREFGKDTTIRVDDAELDVHRTFVTGPFGLTVDLAGLFADSTPFRVGDAEFLALGAGGLFLHGCYEAALGDWPLRLGSLRDLMAVHAAFTVDEREVLSSARAWRAVAVVQRAARLTADLLDLPLGHGLRRMAAIDVPRREARLLRWYLTPARGYTRPLASMIVIPGLRARLRYAGALVAPSAEYLRDRGWTQRSHALRAVGRLRGRS